MTIDRNLRSLLSLLRNGRASRYLPTDDLSKVFWTDDTPTLPSFLPSFSPTLRSVLTDGLEVRLRPRPPVGRGRSLSCRESSEKDGLRVRNNNDAAAVSYFRAPKRIAFFSSVWWAVLMCRKICWLGCATRALAPHVIHAT